jgi:uncharacterized repeat protein (TIGR03803 family)
MRPSRCRFLPIIGGLLTFACVILAAQADNVFYGTTNAGGASDRGTVFELANQSAVELWKALDRWREACRNRDPQGRPPAMRTPDGLSISG